MKITLDNLDRVYSAGQASVESMQLKGYELVETFFVDSSGWGLESEPALTPANFNTELERCINENGPLTAKLTSVGQFQVYVGLFKKTGKSKAKKIANNTYLIVDGDTRSIRLHDTNILVEKDGQITIDTGNWHTVTTKDRLNRYLPSGTWISQKNYDWFLHQNEDVTPYNDGVVIAGKLEV